MQKLTLFATILALTVVLLGVYTRLKDAGLGCPDWPFCYGKIIAPKNIDDASHTTQSTNTNNVTTTQDLANVTSTNPQDNSNTVISNPNDHLIAKQISKPYEREKASIEMIHRYIAGFLGIFIFFIAFKILKSSKKYKSINSKISIFLMIMVVFQALLGMWTVTLKLYPIVVMLHLLGGLTILALLWLLHLNCGKVQLIIDHSFNYAVNNNKLMQLKTIAAITLILTIIQLALGGWVSANYAALVCNDFPTCQGSIWPTLNFKAAFDLFNPGIFRTSSDTLDNVARVTIQMSHRIGALILLIFTFFMCYKLYTTKIASLMVASIITLVLILTQVILGISNVMFGLPLTTAVLHSAFGALLLLSMITVNFLVLTKVRKALY